MIINIPLQVDEQQMEEVIKRDYESKVLDKIVDYIKTCLMSHSGSIYSSYKSKDEKLNDGMSVLIEGQIKDFLNDHSEEIIESASKILADKLAKSKKGKAIFEGLGEKNA